MNDLKTMIENNLYLRVDFDNRYKKTKGGVIQDTKFFLIGVLPVVIIYQNGEYEKASMNYALEVGRDPLLRNLQGVKATDHEKTGSYREKMSDIVSKMESGFLKTMELGKFKGKDFEKILIINFDLTDAGNTNHKNRRDQAVCEECQKASNQAD